MPENNKISCMFDSSVILNETLAHFYVDLRKPEGGCRYKVTLFESLHNGLNNCLKPPPPLHNRNFLLWKIKRGAITNFWAQIAEMKSLRTGLAVVDHHPDINAADQTRLYIFMFRNPETPSRLANKVQFDIRLYFFRRGMENMEKMRKTDLRVHTDSQNTCPLEVGDKTTVMVKNNHRKMTKNISHRVCNRTIKENQ